MILGLKITSEKGHCVTNIKKSENNATVNYELGNQKRNNERHSLRGVSILRQQQFNTETTAEINETTKQNRTKHHYFNMICELIKHVKCTWGQNVTAY